MRNNRANGSDFPPKTGKNSADSIGQSGAAGKDSRKITKIDQKKKRIAKLRDLDESRALAGLATSLGCDFVAIGESLLSSPTSSTHTKLIKDTIRSWLRARYWGDAMILADTYHLPAPDSLPQWKALPAEVAQFFKLLFVLEHPDAVFVTIRLDPDIGERALASPRGPCDWLAERVNRALRKAGVNPEYLAFSIEYAPRQAKTLHRLHIHGAMRIPIDLRHNAAEALKEALAPAYTTHGKNQAIKLEKPWKTTDVARYAPKEAAFKTEHRLVIARGGKRGSSAHRAAETATIGGRSAYRQLSEIVYGNSFSYAGLPDFS